MDDIGPDLDVQSYITENQESYLQDYKANNDVFDKIKQQYEDILGNIELRYKNLAEDYEATISSQAAELYDLELTLDQLKNSHKESVMDTKMTMQLDQIVLRAQE